jgi:maltose O-acetyltransferase
MTHAEPWTAGRERRSPAHYLTRALAIARARAILRHARLGPRVGASGALRADIRGTCRIGARVTFRGGMIPTLLCVHPGATLVVGEETVLNYGVSIEAHERIELGARCMVASMVRIADFDARGARPVWIGDDVWIAHGAIVGPGVTIGRGAVVAAGSVVSSDVPPEHVASGNPAHVAPLSLLSRAPVEAPDVRQAR